MSSIKTLVEQIQGLGLTASEARAYLAVVKSGPCTVLQIARNSALQRTEIYALMPRLAKLGLVEETLDRPRRYHAIDPKTGLASLAKYSVKQTQSIMASAKQLVSALDSLDGMTELEIEPAVRILTGARTLRARFREAVKSAKKEVWMMAGATQILATERSELKSFLRIISLKRLRARLITELDPRTASHLRNQTPLVKIRHCLELRSGMYGVDESMVALGLGSKTDAKSDGGSYLVLSHPATVGVIRNFYEVLWENTIPFEAWIAGREEASGNSSVRGSLTGVRKQKGF